MSNVVSLHHPREVRRERYRQACKWLLRLQAGLSAAETRELDAWLSVDPGHRAALIEMATLSDQMNALAGLADLFPLEHFPIGARGRGSAREERRRRRRLVGVTAVALLACSGLLAGLYLMTATEDSVVAEATRYATEPGRQLSVELPDGSEIVLNTGTSLEVSYSSGERRVRLEQGEAYLVVVADLTRPFRVQAGSRLIEVLGTAFSVQRTAGGSLEITVSEGEVNLLRQAAESPSVPSAVGADTQVIMPSPSRTDDGMRLVSGDHLSLDENSGAIRLQTLQPGDVDARLAWRHGMLFFQGEPLEYVLREVNRYTTVRIQAEAEILQVPVIGVFRVDNIERLLAAMQENFQFDVDRSGGDHIVLRQR